MSGILTTEVLEPYAQALMSIGQSQNLVDRFGEDIQNILDTLNESEDLRQLISSPLAKADLKKGVLRQVFGEALHPYTNNFLMLLVDRRRILFLDGICQQFQVLLRKLRNTVLAEVTSAVPLTDGQQDSVRQKVTAMTGASQVELQAAIDPELIGGVIIKVGSQVIDASLRGQLRRIALKLTSAA
jgi:F-type H+-transporting ATPase subunit delta